MDGTSGITGAVTVLASRIVQVRVILFDSNSSCLVWSIVWKCCGGIIGILSKGDHNVFDSPAFGPYALIFWYARPL